MKYTIHEYCKHICKAHIEVLRYNKDKGWFWDLPAVASICHSKKQDKQEKSYSHKPNSTNWHNALRCRIINMLGQIGTKSQKTGCKYIIGNCAEQHAANRYMKKYNENKTNMLWFSPAMRPRTKEIIPPCANCKNLFQNL